MLQAAREGNDHTVEIKPCTNDNSSFLDVTFDTTLDVSQKAEKRFDVAFEIKWHKSMFDIRIQ